MFGKARGGIGLDIGSSMVKAVELVTSGSKLRVKSYALAPVSSPDDVEKAVRAVIEKGGFADKLVATAVSGRSVFVRYVAMPKMPLPQLHNHARYEADRYFPFEVEELTLDCQILNYPDEPPPGQLNVLLVGVKKSQIEQHVELIKRCGLTPMVIDVDAFALGNAYELHTQQLGNSSETSAEVIGLIDIGGNKTSINILAGSASYFTREIYLAGKDFSEAISRRMGISAEEAEKLKLNPGEQVEEVEDAITTVMEDLGNEIQLSFDYFENQFDKEINKVVLSGGSVKLPGLARTLETTFDRPIVFWDPLENIEVAGELDEQELLARSHQLAIAVGLAARTASGR